jgi:hypothetical protein
MPNVGGGAGGFVNVGLGGMGVIAGGMMGMTGIGGTPQRAVTRCLQLSNMVQQEDLDTDEDYTDLTDDVTGEMTKYAVAAGGAVSKIVIPKGNIAEGADGGVGNIYVEFSTLEASVKAFMDLPTRKFGEAYIKAVYYPEDKMSSDSYVDILKEEEAQRKNAAAATAAVLSSKPTMPTAAFIQQMPPQQQMMPPQREMPPQPQVSGGGRGIGGGKVEVLGAAPALGMPPASAPAAPGGRGRGRGRTLPAWMTAQGTQ